MSLVMFWMSPVIWGIVLFERVEISGRTSNLRLTWLNESCWLVLIVLGMMAI